MVAAPKSGSGKTTVTCALLWLLKEKGLQAASFKCGPDYIDPMFHEEAIQVPARNLDTFFTGEGQTRELFLRHAQNRDIAVLEGVMGLYDGLGGVREEGSSYHLAEVTKTPIVLTVDAKGMGKSILPLLSGFLAYDKSHLIKGVVLNRVSKGYYGMIKPLIEKELAIKAVGFLPEREEYQIGSRHLGLVLPDELEDIQKKLGAAAEEAAKTVSLGDILEIAGSAGELELPESHALELAAESLETAGSAGELELPESHVLALASESLETAGELGLPKSADTVKALEGSKAGALKPLHGVAMGTAKGGKKFGVPKAVIAVARDEAFCFYYADNLRLLEEYGAEITYFSPLHEERLPVGCHALLFGGGYPELYAKGLSRNCSMRQAVKHAAGTGMPIVAECGGFLYLHSAITDKEGASYGMAGVLPGTCFYTGKLVRFGYIELQEKKSSFLPKGERIKGHEFHYYDSTNNGADATAVKPASGREYPCMIAEGDCFLGFPHLYYPSNPAFAKSFVEKAERYKKRLG